ncbi:MAG: tetratricopeptide repeat protein [bacterium]|nr:tetratricopeptide repeat protein [bacterium]
MCVLYAAVLGVLALVGSTTAEPLTSAPAWRALADQATCLCDEGHPERAMALLDADGMATNCLPLRACRSRALAEAGLLAQSVSNDVWIIQHMKQTGAGDAADHVAAAQAALRLQQHDLALTYLQRALRGGGARGAVYVAAGDLYLAVNDAARAEQYYDKAQACGDRSAHVLYQRAQLLLDDAARAAALAALASNAPDYFPAQCARIQAACLQEHYAEAAALLAVCATTHPANVTVQSLRILLAEATGATGEAARLAGELHTRAPAWSEDLTLRGELWHSRRQFARAAAYASLACARRPGDADAMFLLARCELAQGASERARTVLDALLRQNPYHRTAFNFLGALDYIDRTFVSMTSAHAIVRLHPRDAQVMGDEVTNLVEQYWHTYAPKYAVQPTTPLRIELMNRQADFAARTVGMPTFGALGVCFGGYIAMVSPQATADSANWEQTLRHEFIHVLTLQASDMGIQRWFTEGLSVAEEEGTLGERDQALLVLLTSTGFVSFTTFDAAFSGPNVVGAYQLAGHAVRFLIAQHGWTGVCAAVQAYAAAPFDQTLPARALGTTTQALDAAFCSFIHTQLLPQLTLMFSTNAALVAAPVTNAAHALVAAADLHVDDFALQVRAARACGTNDAPTAARLYQRAYHINPYQAQVYEAWPELLQRQGQLDAALRMSTIYTLAAPHDWRAHLQHAAALVALGRTNAACRALAEAEYFAPDEPAVKAMAQRLPTPE